MCNIHYNRDHCHHQQQQRNGNMCITECSCIVCHEKVQATKSLLCPKHVLQVNNGEPFLCAVSCTFFSEYISESAKINDNEDFYHQMECNTTVSSQISSHLCTKCRDPFLEMAKMKMNSHKKKLKKIVNSIDFTKAYSEKVRIKKTRQRLQKNMYTENYTISTKDQDLQES